MKFEQVGNGYIAKNDRSDKIAEITYSPAGEKIVIVHHTYVSKEMEGQGMGGRYEAIWWLKWINWEIRECPYVRTLSESSRKSQKNTILSLTINIIKFMQN